MEIINLSPEPRNDDYLNFEREDKNIDSILNATNGLVAFTEQSIEEQDD